MANSTEKERNLCPGESDGGHPHVIKLVAFETEIMQVKLKEFNEY